MPFLRADSGPWRQMSMAWPAMSAKTTPSGSTLFYVSTVLGEKASDVVHSRGASAELPDRRPTPHWTEEDN